MTTPGRRETFLAAAASYVAQVGRIPTSALDGPGLGDWDLRALIGHASRSLVTVETYLDSPADAVEIPDAASYYLAIEGVGRADPAAVVERGRQAGAALSDDPASAVRDLAERVEAKLSAYDATYVLTTIAGGMRLEEYLRTRTFELVVHGLDIAAATGVDPAFEPASLVDAAGLATEVAILAGHGPAVLLALTGRQALPVGFSVV